MTDYFAERHPQQDGDSNFVWKSTIRAKACDTARGLLPAATLSNVGIYGTGQAYEMALLRMQAHPLEEVRLYGQMMLEELRKMIPSFLKRVDLPDRGVLASDYQSDIAAAMRTIAAGLDAEPEERDLVTLTDWDPETETNLVAAALYGVTDLPDSQLTAIARRMSGDEKAKVIAAYVGERGNRRHKPGRGMERSYYRFDILCDYGGFRDLQRHRMLTLEWQPLSARLGYDVPAELAEVSPSLTGVWHDAMDRAGTFYEKVTGEPRCRRRPICCPVCFQREVRDADECPRGFSPHRTPHSTGRASQLPESVPGDASPDSRGGRTPPDRRGHEVSSITATRIWNDWSQSAKRKSEEVPSF